MRPRVCTIDSSCVIALDHLDLLPKLSLLFARVFVPKAVRDELSKRRATKNRLRSIFKRYATLQPCDKYDKKAVDVLLAVPIGQGKRDRGEAEAVVQAVQLGASVLVDDPWGRNQAEKHDLDRHGTLWILRQFCELRFLSPSELRLSLRLLLRRGIRLPLGDVNALLGEMGEEPLASYGRG